MPDIVLVMRKRGNLKVLGEALGRHGYAVTGATTAHELDEALAVPVAPDGALVDVSGYGEDVWPMCQALQRSQVPFLVISGPRQVGVAAQGLGYGAASVLEKPLVKSSLLKLLEGLIRR